MSTKNNKERIRGLNKKSNFVLISGIIIAAIVLVLVLSFLPCLFCGGAECNTCGVGFFLFIPICSVPMILAQIIFLDMSASISKSLKGIKSTPEINTIKAKKTLGAYLLWSPMAYPAMFASTLVYAFFSSFQILWIFLILCGLIAYIVEACILIKNLSKTKRLASNKK